MKICIKLKKVDIVNLFNFVKKIKNFSKNATFVKFFGLLFIDTIKADYNIGVKNFKKLHIYAKDSSCSKVFSKKLQVKAKVKSPSLLAYFK